ncbi:MAG TPA: thiamine phosphate synthase [Pirellulales bacterium]|jgi:thiamine-phosphate pyrophosphorylase|nr:thiamine phosphate synthase [Pirellulales bacterium]
MCSAASSLNESSDRHEPAEIARDEIAAWRIIDAAANRAGEGLRVVEDYLRFGLDDRHLMTLCKVLRHDLTAMLAEFPNALRLAARDTLADVGTAVATSAERTRPDLNAVALASFKRTEQALRSLEEYAKLVAPAAAAICQGLRYRLYTLERSTELTRRSGERLAGARLYGLIDGGDSLEAFSDRAARLIEAGVHVLQLRDKQLDDRRLLERARRLRALTAGTATLFIMNDRPDLARLAAADGVHLGQEELGVKEARAIVGPWPLIGVSTHSLAQARAAVLAGASYLGVGPTFPSTTKSFAAFPGLELLRAVASEIRLPAFAIGGISLENLDDVMATGIGRVAVSRALGPTAESACGVREFLARLSNTTTTHGSSQGEG